MKEKAYLAFTHHIMQIASGCDLLVEGRMMLRLEQQCGHRILSVVVVVSWCYGIFFFTSSSSNYDPFLKNKLKKQVIIVTRGVLVPAVVVVAVCFCCLLHDALWFLSIFCYHFILYYYDYLQWRAKNG